MELEERLQLILLRIKKLQTQFVQSTEHVQELRIQNKELKEENDALKKINFEQNKKIEIANIANQLSEDEKSADELKRQIDTYIREVDAAIAALKKWDE